MEKPMSIGFVGGLVVASVVSALFVKFGYQMPGWMQPKSKVTAAIKGLVAEVAADRENPEELQRMLAVRLATDPSGYIEADNELGGLLTREIMWQSFTKDQVEALSTGLRALNRYEEEYDWVEGAAERILDDQLKPLVDQFLERRFPRLPGESRAERLGRVNRILATASFPEITQEPRFGQVKIPFRMNAAAAVTVTIECRDLQPVHLIEDQMLPPGVYLLSWDKRDRVGREVAVGSSCAYLVRTDDRVLAGESFEVPSDLPPWLTSKLEGVVDRAAD